MELISKWEEKITSTESSSVLYLCTHIICPPSQTHTCMLINEKTKSLNVRKVSLVMILFYIFVIIFSVLRQVNIM